MTNPPLAYLQDKARERGLLARFLRWDVLKLADLGESFDTMLDCGLFHPIGVNNRQAYADGARSALVAGGRCFMLLLGDNQHEAGHAHHGTIADVTATFAIGWRVDSIEPVTVDTAIDPDGLPGWLPSPGSEVG